MKHPYNVYPNSGFITIAIPTYNRPQYLRRALDSLKEFADINYEVIVHDDGSTPENRKKLEEMSDDISTLIFNNGSNTGLVGSANRAISLASSKFVVFMADDCFLSGKCLKGLCDVLSKPYVGLVSPINEPGPFPDEWVSVSNGTRFCVSSGLGGGAACAFRKEVFDEVGGFDPRSPSSQSDNVFIFKILRKGYWKALLEGNSKIELGNYVYGDDYIPTQPMMGDRDGSFPKIFGVDPQKLSFLSRVKHEATVWWCDGERTIPNRDGYDGRENPVAGLNDIDYWGNHFLSLFGGKNSDNYAEINWEVAKKHGHDKWRQDIEKDFGGVK